MLCITCPLDHLPHWASERVFFLVTYKAAKTGRTDSLCGFVVASHYQSLRIIVLLLQTCLLGSEALSRTLLLQQLHRLQQDRRFRLSASLFCFLKTDGVASFLGKQ